MKVWHQNPQKNLVEKKGLKEEGEDENSTEQIKRKMEEEYDENINEGFVEEEYFEWYQQEIWIEYNIKIFKIYY